ncbi:MAG TPA: CHAT domain-containing protein [Anaerolineales bacterium]|nr:CHAT domain-containing protein [Anaerolineales bacterium]
MTSNPFFDPNVLVFTSDVTIAQVHQHLSTEPNLPSWSHLVVVFPDGAYRVITIQEFLSLYGGWPEEFRQRPLSDLGEDLLIPARLLDIKSVERVSPERLIQLALGELSRIFLVGDPDRREIFGRIWDPDRGEAYEMAYGDEPEGYHAANGGSGRPDPGEEETSDAAADDALTPGDSGDKRRVTTFPNIESQDHAHLDETFTVRVKLSDQAQQETGGHLHVPEFNFEVSREIEIIPVEISLYAPDFELAPEDAGNGWDRETKLYVAARASGEIVFHLRPEDRLQARFFSTLRLTFRINGIVVGQALRRVEVLRDAGVEPTPVAEFPPIEFSVDAERVFTTTPSETLRLRMPAPDEQPVDLHVTIMETDDRSRMVWKLDAPGAGLRKTATSRNLSAENWVRKQLGEFIRQAMRQAPAGGEFTSRDGLRFFGLLITLHEAAPAEFWDVYTQALAAHAQAGGTPETFTLLFVTEDPHLPWELMPVSRDPDADGKPPQLLGSAHRVGRWLLGLEAGSPQPSLSLEGMSVAVPDYRKELPGTQAMKTFAAPWNPHLVGVRDGGFDPAGFYEFMASGDPTGGTGILHYAGHGDCCKDMGKLVWLMLSDEADDVYDYNAANSPLSNRFAKRERDVLVFFNACTAGQAAETELGTTASWSQVMLDRGYDSYIGPLWYVDDGYARDVAETFYALAIGEAPLPLGEVMRRIRSKYMENLRLYTYLAYSYYGHPNATVTFTPFKETNDVDDSQL